MRKIEVKKEEFLSTCVTMLMGLDKLEVNTQTLMLIKVLENLEPEGCVVKADFKKKILASKLFFEKNFEQLLYRLQLGGHLKVRMGIIYPDPKYVAIAWCEGNLLITEKETKN